MKWTALFLGLAVSLFARTEIVAAGEVPGKHCLTSVCFAKELRIGAQTIALLGSAKFRYLIFDVYTAALYGTPQWSTTREFRTDTPSELVLEYHRSIAAKDFADSALELLRKQNRELPPEVSAGVKKLHAAYRDVQEGDRYALRFDPAAGTTLLLNGNPLVSIPGKDFAYYYFRIWLDRDQPLDRDVRDQLFGNPQ